jgi:hypothetical protein
VVLPDSNRISRVPSYSGTYSTVLLFSHTGLSPFLAGFSNTVPLISTLPLLYALQPPIARNGVWALTRSLAATKAISKLISFPPGT